MYAVCLLPNHFHLSLQTRKDPILQIMSSLATGFSMYYNRAYSHFGPVFQNRYKSILIQNEAYFIQLSQYIYLNPVLAGLVSDPVNYSYSTFGEAIGLRPLHLLDTAIVRLIGETKHSKEEYRKFVYEGMNADFSGYGKVIYGRGGSTRE